MITDKLRIRAIRFFETVMIDMSDAPNDERLHMSRRLCDTLDFITPVVVAAKDARIAELEAALADARDRALEEAAKVADQYSNQNKEASAKHARRANRLGSDPFGHGDMAASASFELDACAREADAIAVAIRAMKGTHHE